MRIRDAVELIRFEGIANSRGQIWGDFGCGTGTFTKALAELLPRESVIYAVDVNRISLAQIPERYGGATIHPFAADFRKDELRLPPMDGVLFANSLHFVREQNVILKMASQLAARTLVVEYDITVASVWVQYPLNFEKLRAQFVGLKYKNVVKLRSRPSRYRGEIYAAMAER